jgi:hypothetical protein
MSTSDKPITRADLDDFKNEILAAMREMLAQLRPPEPPVDPDMLARTDRARANPASGVPHEAFLKEFGL